MIVDSVTFPVSGGDYTRVCGRISREGFVAHDAGWWTTIDGAYVDGVSHTHGSPRQHIWTFAAGWSEITMMTVLVMLPSILPFVGGDYFCESTWNAYTVPGNRSGMEMAVLLAVHLLIQQFSIFH